MKREKGQSLVEFALILPLIVFLLLGVVDFSRIFHSYLTIDHAGREAARAASIGRDDSTIEGVAVSQGSSINLTTDQVAVEPPVSPPDKRNSGTDVTITISYPVTFLTPLISNVVGPLTLKNKTVMRVE